MFNFSSLIDYSNPEPLPLESDSSITVLGSFIAIVLIARLSKTFLNPIKNMCFLSLLRITSNVITNYGTNIRNYGKKLSETTLKI